nr:beta-D-glucosyl crocetin beta-1,6-glucosyltransferase-like [Ipomoea batatas]
MSWVCLAPANFGPGSGNPHNGLRRKESRADLEISHSLAFTAAKRLASPCLSPRVRNQSTYIASETMIKQTISVTIWTDLACVHRYPSVWNIDEVNQNVMVDSPSSDDFVSLPVVLPPHAQTNPPLDDVDNGLAGEEVELFSSLKICGSPKRLVSPMKRFNACQKRAVREIGL